MIFSYCFSFLLCQAPNDRLFHESDVFVPLLVFVYSLCSQWIVYLPAVYIFPSLSIHYGFKITLIALLSGSHSRSKPFTNFKFIRCFKYCCFHLFSIILLPFIIIVQCLYYTAKKIVSVITMDNYIGLFAVY